MAADNRVHYTRGDVIKTSVFHTGRSFFVPFEDSILVHNPYQFQNNTPDINIQSGEDTIPILLCPRGRELPCRDGRFSFDPCVCLIDPTLARSGFKGLKRLICKISPVYILFALLFRMTKHSLSNSSGSSQDYYGRRRIFSSSSHRHVLMIHCALRIFSTRDKKFPRSQISVPPQDILFIPP